MNGIDAAAENSTKRNWKRVLRRSLLSLLSLVCVCVLMFYILLRFSLPKTGGQTRVSGLSDAAVVRFDQLQRPYVQAKSFEDALVVQGWLHAAHRLWQMEMFRRAGRGRLAELLGTSLLATDQQLYKIGVPQLAKQLEQNASAELLSRIQAYVSGVNEGIQSLTALPPEFWLLSARVQPWTQQDVFAVGAVLAYQSAGNMQNELFRLELSRCLTPDQMRVFLTDTSQLVDYPFVLDPQTNESEQATHRWPIRSDAGRRISESGVAPSVMPAMEQLALLETSANLHLPRLGLGSNGWCVAPSKTASGNAIFAFDSHDELGLPNLFYEIHLFFGNDKQVRGWSVAGLPGVVNGYNHRIAWGFTNIGDTQDLFLETQHPQDSNQFRHEDAWYTARMEQVEIPVAGKATPVSLAIRYSKNGPLISDDPPISLRWTAHEIGELGLEAFLDLNLAENWIQFNAALDRLAAPSLNATYADVEGNIGFRTAGLLPDRSHGEGLVPSPGDGAAYGWKGQVAAEDQPRIFNPPAGFVAAANARVNASGNGPLVSADNAAPYRIQRIRNVLSSSRDITTDTMRQLQVDWHDAQAERVLQRMLQGLSDQQLVDQTVKLSDQAQAAMELLRGWQANPVASADSSAAVIFQVWYRELAVEIFAQPLGETLLANLMRRNYLLNHAVDSVLLGEVDPAGWWNDGALRLAKSLERALAELSDTLGADIKSWRLDRCQRISLAHELGSAEPRLAPLFNVKPRPMGGGPASVGRASYRYDRPFQVSQAATVRVVVEMSSMPQAFAIMPAGQSGHPFSRHYSDQLQDWLSGNLVPIASSPADVQGSRLTLLPVERPARR